MGVWEVEDRQAARTGRNQQLVYEAMVKSGKPMRAYELLKLLHADGIRSPLQVYRVLDKLVREGKARKIETLRAFAVCGEPSGGGQMAVAICIQCGQTDAIADAGLKRQLVELSRGSGSLAQTAAISNVWGTAPKSAPQSDRTGQAILTSASSRSCAMSSALAR